MFFWLPSWPRANQRIACLGVAFEQLACFSQSKRRTRVRKILCGAFEGTGEAKIDKGDTAVFGGVEAYFDSVTPWGPASSKVTGGTHEFGSFLHPCAGAMKIGELVLSIESPLSDSPFW